MIDATSITLERSVVPGDGWEVPGELVLKMKVSPSAAEKIYDFIAREVDHYFGQYMRARDEGHPFGMPALGEYDDDYRMAWISMDEPMQITGEDLQIFIQTEELGNRIVIDGIAEPRDFLGLDGDTDRMKEELWPIAVYRVNKLMKDAGVQ